LACAVNEFVPRDVVVCATRSPTTLAAPAVTLSINAPQVTAIATLVLTKIPHLCTMNASIPLPTGILSPQRLFLLVAAGMPFAVGTTRAS
jgi:hypothetical protein